ncbi:hypothetical protein ACFLTV_02100 [Chloroflexota bacterium]
MRFKIVQGDEQLSSHSGLALAGAILHRSSIRKRLDAVVLPEHPFPEISHGEVATAMIGLICLGKPDFDAIEAFFGMTPFSFSPWNWLQYHLVRPSGNGWTA